MTTGQLAVAICAQKGWDASSRPFRDALVHKAGGKLPRFKLRGQLIWDSAAIRTCGADGLLAAVSASLRNHEGKTVEAI